MGKVGDVPTSHNGRKITTIEFSVMYHKCLTEAYIGDLKKTRHLSSISKADNNEKVELGIRPTCVD